MNRMRYTTALLLLLPICLSLGCTVRPMTEAEPVLTWRHGGIVRGDRTQKELALIFTGGDRGEGSKHILDTLADNGVIASFFVTGGYVAQPDHHLLLQRMVDSGHYLGPHSHAHLLYAPWDDRSKTLVTEAQFKEDLQKNIIELQAYGAMPKGDPIYFIPPYEWYNAQHAKWAADMGCQLFNYTNGSGSHRDWIPEGHLSFRPSTQILQDILHHEANNPDGLNGHLLLLHLGGEREDKMFLLLGELIEELHKRGYHFMRVDELLDTDRKF